MKRTHNKVTDSDDEMDHLPLKYITLDCKKNKSIHNLRGHSLNACEFCEKIFDNKYDYLIHNAKHIIIPLIKMLPSHCSQCSCCCFSEEEMNDHMSVKHNIYNKQNDIKNDNGELKIADTHNLKVDESNEDETPLNCFIKKNDVVVKTENILQNFMMNCKVDIEKFVPSWQYESDEGENNDVDTNGSELKNHGAVLKPSTNVNNISNGFNFKNKIVELIPSPKSNNIIRSDTDNLKNEANSDHSLVLPDVEDPIVILPSVKKEIVTECSINQDSIHFDDLIKPGIFYCKRCYKRFPNRFEVILHEIVHLNVTLTLSESYNFNGKTNSVITIPPALDSKFKYLACCKNNGAVSDKKMHDKTCFKYHCADCDRGFNEKNLLSAHEAQCIGLGVVMCDTCLYLRKRPKHVRYYGIARFSNLEVKQMCHWCGKVCNEMSQVTLVNRERLADRIKFEGDMGDQETNIEEHVVKSEEKNVQVNKETTETRGGKRKGGHKTLSNRERLKLIQTRLKSMKK